MRILVLQFDADKGLGLLEPPLAATGVAVDVRLDERAAVPLDDVSGLIVLGGIADPDADDATRAALATTERALASGVPVLGVCLGAEILALAAGGGIRRCPPEYGFHEVALTPAARADALLGGLPGTFHVFQAHGLACDPPAGAVLLASSAECLQAFRIGDRAWGVQFHLEPTTAMIVSWLASAPVAATLERVGVDASRFETDALRHVPAWEQWAGDIGRRFARIAGDFDAAISVLLRWEQHGATWRTTSISATGAVVELCTCHGEPVEVLRSSDPELLRYLADRPRSHD